MFVSHMLQVGLSDVYVGSSSHCVPVLKTLQEETPTPEPTPVGCSRTLNATGTNQTITSPGWPEDYPNNADCRWTIVAREGYRVRIESLSFNTENVYDFLSVYENGTEQERHSGTGSFVIVSSGNIVVLTFTSDTSVQNPGFELVFQETNEETTVAPQATTAAITTEETPTPEPTSAGIPRLRCPEPANACSRRSAWLCDYIQWRVTFMNDWQRTFLQWRDHVPGEIPREDCRHLYVSCKNPGQHGSALDPYGCEISYCKDGYYNDMQVMDDWVADSRLWRRYFEAWKRALAQTPAQGCN